MSRAESSDGPESGVLFLIEALGSIRALLTAATTERPVGLSRQVVEGLIDQRAFHGGALRLEREDAADALSVEGEASVAASGLSAPLLEVCTEILDGVRRTGCAHHEPDLSRRSDVLSGSLIVLPIATPGRMAGALAVWNRAAFHFRPWHEQLLELHCDLLALALRPRDIPAAGVTAPSRRAASPGPGAQRLDPLTGLLDRHAFEAKLQSLLDAGLAVRIPLYLLYLDIDRFGLIRDYGGDEAADRVIAIVADILRRQAGHEIALGRLGGDEFAILANLETQEGAFAMAQRLIQTVDAQRLSHAGQPCDISISVGLVPIRGGWRSGRLALSQARDACGGARRQGGGAIQVYSEAVDRQRRFQDDGRMFNQLTGALKENRLRLFAQPIVPVTGGAKGQASAAVAYEILVRLLDKHGNPHDACDFLPLAERYGLSVKLDRWVIAETFRLLAAGTGSGMERREFALNLSGHSIDDPRLLDFIVERFAVTGLPPGRICFEITETAAISDIDAARHFIRVLKDIGCKFALDDFGSGHSSFLYLRDLEVDYLKIDGMLVREIVRDPVSLAFVRSIHDIGKIMGKRTIAEYVEDDQVLEAVVEIGIDFAQGFWVGRPEPLERWLSHWPMPMGVTNRRIQLTPGRKV